MEPGPIIASGRDGDIYEYGPGRVLRRTRDGRSIEHEARIMQYVAEHGYPVPAIYDVLNDGRDIVMERIDGPTLLEVIEQKPWRVPRYGRLLAELHQRLHEIVAPDWLPNMGGTAVIHRDLHPLNVLMPAKGPVVIDWPNAAAGPAELDVADAWLLMAGASPENPNFLERVMLGMRVVLVAPFLRRFDRNAVVPFLRVAAEGRSRDRNMSQTEIAAMWRLVAKEEAKLA
jgi:Ser/Thr protein kinase RdoA (MazF antagonist)